MFGLIKEKENHKKVLDGMGRSILLMWIIIISILLNSCRLGVVFYHMKKQPLCKAYPKRLEINYPEIRVNKEFSKIIDTVLYLTKKCNGLSYRQVKGFYVSAIMNPYHNGKQRKKSFHFESVPDFMIIDYLYVHPNNIKGLMIQDGKLFMFICAGFDTNYMNETGDSLKLELKFSWGLRSGLIRYKITCIEGKSFKKERFHWYLSIQNMEEFGLYAIIDYDETWFLEKYCFRINPLFNEGKIRPRIMGDRFGIPCHDNNNAE